MTFGKVNELGQFIREAEPEPDVKKSKGMIHSHLSLSLSLCYLARLSLSHYFLCPHSVIFDLTSLCSEYIYSVPMNINLMLWLLPFSTQLKAF